MRKLAVVRPPVAGWVVLTITAPQVRGGFLGGASRTSRAVDDVGASLIDGPREIDSRFYGARTIG